MNNHVLPQEQLLNGREFILIYNTFLHGGNCMMSHGKIKDIWGFDLDHKISTEPGS